MVKGKTKISNSSIKLKGILILLAIVVVLVSFVMYGTQVFYPDPVFDEFCKDIEYQVQVSSCDNFTASGEESYPSVLKDCYCDIYDTKNGTIQKCMTQNPDMQICQEKYDLVKNSHDFWIFIILTIIGAGLIVVNFLIKNDIVSNSFMGGGVVILFIGVVSSWNNFGEIIRFIMLGAILGVLIFITIKKLGDK